MESGKPREAEGLTSLFLTVWVIPCTHSSCLKSFLFPWWFGDANFYLSVFKLHMFVFPNAFSQVGCIIGCSNVCLYKTCSRFKRALEVWNSCLNSDSHSDQYKMISSELR